MPKLQTPLLSIAAKGKFDNQLIYSSWNGRPYAKRTANQSNPNTPAQATYRTMFAFLCDAWPYLSAQSKATWNAPAEEKRIQPPNAFIAYNLARWLHFKMPQQEFKMPQTSTPPGIAIHYLTAGAGILDTYIETQYGTPPWAIAIFHFTTSATTPIRNALAAIQRLSSSDIITHRRRNLTAGNYWENALCIAADGRSGNQNVSGPAAVY